MFAGLWPYGLLEIREEGCFFIIILNELEHVRLDEGPDHPGNLTRGIFRQMRMRVCINKACNKFLLHLLPPVPQYRIEIRARGKRGLPKQNAWWPKCLYNPIFS
jgi:hypothetical protein